MGERSKEWGDFPFFLLLSLLSLPLSPYSHERLHNDRQVDCKGRSLAFFALSEYVSPVLLYNSIADAEPQPGPLTNVLGGEKRLKYAA